MGAAGTFCILHRGLLLWLLGRLLCGAVIVVVGVIVVVALVAASLVLVFLGDAAAMLFLRLARMLLPLLLRALCIYIAWRGGSSVIGILVMLCLRRYRCVR